MATNREGRAVALEAKLGNRISPRDRLQRKHDKAMEAFWNSDSYEMPPCPEELIDQNLRLESSSRTSAPSPPLELVREWNKRHIDIVRGRWKEAKNQRSNPGAADLFSFYAIRAELDWRDSHLEAVAIEPSAVVEEPAEERHHAPPGEPANKQQAPDRFEQFRDPRSEDIGGEWWNTYGHLLPGD